LHDLCDVLTLLHCKKQLAFALPDATGLPQLGPVVIFFNTTRVKLYLTVIEMFVCKVGLHSDFCQYLT